MIVTLAKTPIQDRSAEDVEVTVVMPCLNEALTLGRCIDKARSGLDQMGVQGEVLIADNGSDDGSPDIAREHGARVVNVPRKGYGAALQAGVGAARGRFIIMGDADDSYDFTKLSPFVDKLRQGDELVMGNRFQGGINKGAMPWHHKYIGNPVLTGVLNLFFHSPIGDAHCGLRGFRKESFERLKLTTTGMEFASEMVVKACLLRQKISEVPVVLHKDGRDRPPHLRSFRDGWRHLRFLLLYCPFWLYLIPAALLMGVGLGLMIGSVGLDVHTMLLGSLGIIMGYQTLWLWAYARIHGWTSGMLPRDTFSLNVFEHINLERGCIAGLGMLAAGLGLNGWLFAGWVGQDMGPLDIQSSMRVALWGFTLIVLGVQTIYGSFFLSMLGMAERSKVR
jgi:glycosyltransferase involved in cell wall biosynthesis